MNVKKTIILLLCLCCFHIICNYLWIKKDYFSFSPEKFWTLCQEHELLLNFKIKTHGVKGYLDKVKRILKVTFITDRYKPRLIPAYTAAINYYFGENINNTLLSNIPFLVLAIVFIFLLGKELFSAKAGLLSAFIISFYPGFFGMSRSYGIDFPLISAVLAVFYSLIKTSKAPDRKHLAVFISLFSVSILLNPRVIFFLFGPLVFILYRALEKKEFSSLFKISTALILIILITSIWWLTRIQTIITFLKLFSIHKCNTPSLIKLPFIHGRHFIDVVRHISIFFGIFFLISLILFFIKKNPHRFLLLVFLVTPYFISPPLTTIFDRNFFPLFIGFALITAAGISNIKNFIIRRILIFLMITLSLLQFADLSFGTTFLPSIFYRIGKVKLQDDLWARPPSVNDEAEAAYKFLNSISDYRKNNPTNTYVLVAGESLVADFGIFEYIFFSKSDRFILENFFISQNPDYQNCDFAIIIREKSKERVDRNNPDFEFLKSNRYIRFSYEEREKMYNFFRGLTTLDYVAGKRKIYYLCINSKKGS